MLSPDCAQFALGHPQIAVAALLELRDLLSALPTASRLPNSSLPSFREEAAADEATRKTIPTDESVAINRDSVRGSRRETKGTDARPGGTFERRGGRGRPAASQRRR